MAISLSEHLERAEHHLVCAKHIARALYQDELAKEIERIHREIIIGLEDMYYHARVRMCNDKTPAREQHTAARSAISQNK